MKRPNRRRLRVLIAALVVAGTVTTFGAAPADAHPDPGDDIVHDGNLDSHLEEALATLDAQDPSASDVISEGPFGKITKNLSLVGRGERNVEDATTDVFAHEGFAYTGTFNNPCGGDPEAGVWVWDVEDVEDPKFVTVIPSPTGSRSNDVKVASMSSGDILVHSNEACATGGPGGFEIYNVDDPANPVHLASVRIDEIAEITPLFFAPGALEDVGVHNLFLFQQGDRDLVAVQAEGIFDGFRLFDITDPTNPVQLSGWGAEEIFDPGIGDLTLADDPTGARTLDGVLWMLGITPFNGFGASQNRLLHDFTVTTDGNLAYLAHWDAGLILLDISDLRNPQPISTALDPVNGSLDGEVNSHSVWPSEDGTIVVEGEEDFSVFESEVAPTNLGMQFLNTIPAVAISTSAGDAFEGSQTGNSGTVTATSVAVTSGPLAGQTFDAVEFEENNVPLGDGSVSGNFVWVGRACNSDPFENPLNPGDIAVVRRGACFFSDKEANVAAAGAAAIVVANNQQDSVWSGLRIWDYSDPSNPVLASTFNTTCSADPRAEGCDRNGTYSAHNVQVETRGNRTFAYVSWYWDGMLVLDVTNPNKPVEVARFLDRSGPNDGLANDFWGVYKETNSPFIYGSDRNGGLYIFKEKGTGSGK
jgi:hypothetical protein